jgi:hypothetical protein
MKMLISELLERIGKRDPNSLFRINVESAQWHANLKVLAVSMSDPDTLTLVVDTDIIDTKVIEWEKRMAELETIKP